MKRIFLILLSVAMLSSCTAPTKKQTPIGPDPEAKSFGEEAELLMEAINSISTIDSYIKEKKNASREFRSFNYSMNSADFISPSYNYVDQGLCNLFTVDKNINLASLYIDLCMSSITSFNKWFDLNRNPGFETQVIYNPSINYLRCDIKNEEYEYYNTWSLKTSDEGKVIYTEKSYQGAMYDETHHCIYFSEIHFVEDEYYELVESREWDELDREWVRSYTKMDFNERIIHLYNRFTQEYQTEVHERYGEMHYNNDEFQTYITNDGWFAIFNSKFQQSVFLYDRVMLYDLEGYSSITCEEEILPVDGDPAQFGLPITIEMLDGRVYTNDVDVTIYCEAYYGGPRDNQLVVLPYIIVPFESGPQDAIDYLAELGFTPKFDYVSLFNEALNNQAEFMDSGNMDVYRELTNARYEKLSMETIFKKANSNTLGPIDLNDKITYLDGSYTGNVTFKDGKISLNGTQFTIKDGYASTEEDYYLDVYIISREDNYLVGSQKIEYNGNQKTYDLDFALDLSETLPSPGSYEVKIMIRNHSKEAFSLTGNQIDVTDANGYRFFSNSEGKLFLNVDYRSL